MSDSGSVNATGAGAMFTGGKPPLPPEGGVAKKQPERGGGAYIYT
jgi:hypothetical protein